jgi:hypothetical protein
MPQNFISTVVAKLSDLKAMQWRLDRETADRFNPFNVMHPNENATSRIISFLLNPMETHGQRDVFLKLFISKFIPEWSDFDCPIARPVQIGSPVDLAFSDGTFWLGVENKCFYARDQDDQVDRYLAALRRKSGNSKYRLMYLSPRGEEPPGHSHKPENVEEYKDYLIVGAWIDGVQTTDSSPGERPKCIPNVLSWLDDCRRECVPDNVVTFITQFSKYINAEIGREKEVNMITSEITRLAMQDRQNLESALLICKSEVAIRRKVVTEFLNLLGQELKNWAENQGSDWEVTSKWNGKSWIDDPDMKYLPILLRKKRWPPMCGIAIQGENPALKFVAVGVIAPSQACWNQKKEERENLYGKIDKFVSPDTITCIRDIFKDKTNLCAASSSDWWVAWELLDDGVGLSDWTSDETILRLFSKREQIAGKIILRMGEIAKMIEGIQT